MADIKVSQLPEIASAEAGDFFLLTDTSGAVSKKLDADNVITAVDKGALSAELVSTDTDNMVIQGTDDLLAVLPSADANNQVTTGTDDGVMVDGASFVQTGGSIDGTAIGATTPSTGAFTNETISGYQDLAEIAQPATPSSGFGRMFANSNSLFFKDDAGVVTNLTSAGGGGAWELISSATASSSTSVEFTSGITSGYSLFVLVIKNLEYISANVSLNLRFSTDGGSTYDSSSLYSYVTTKLNSDSTSSSVSSTEDTSRLNIPSIDLTSSSDTENFVVKIFGMQVTGYPTLIHSESVCYKPTTPYLYSNDFNGLYRNTTNVDAFELFDTQGDPFSGEFYLYGVKDS